MAYGYLKKLFGKDAEGKAEALTYEQLEAKIDAEKGLKLVNLEDGGYVSQDKFTAAETDAKGYKKQLEDAQKEIKSYKDMDIDGIKAKIAAYEKEAPEKQAAHDKEIADLKRGFAEERFISKYQFVDEFAKAGVLADFRAKSKDFTYNEADGTFAGADDYMKKLMESHKGAFVIPDADKDADGGNGSGSDGGNAGAGGTQKPNFLGKPGNQSAGWDGNSNPFGFNFQTVRPMPGAEKQ